MYGNPFSEFLASGAFLSIGRGSILQEAAQVITLPNPDDRDLHGLPGMGKTDILRYMCGPEFITHYRKTFFTPYTQEPYLLLFVYVAGWIGSIHPFVLLYREFIKAYREYRDDMAVNHSEIVLPDVSLEEIDDLDGGQAMSLMEPLLRRLIKARVRVAMLLDDFDSDLAYVRLNADETSRLSSWKEYCSFILATERRLEDVNAASKGSPFYKRLTQTPMRDFLPNEAREFLAAILEKKKASLPKEDVDDLIRLAGGFPYLLILGGRALWDLRHRTGLGDSSDKLPDALRPYLEERLAAEFRRMFELYYEGRTAEQRQVLLELAARGSLVLQSEAGDPQHVQLMGLEQYGLVDVDSKGYVTLFSPLFGEYLLSLSAALSTERAMAGTEPSLTGLQTNLYNIFRSKPDEVLTFEELGRRVWSWPADPGHQPSEEDKRKIQIAVSKLRRALEDSGTGERIVNLRSRGYRFEPAN
jgi:hypothetical protein